MRPQPTITMMAISAADPDALEYISLDDRRNHSGGWQEHPVRSGRLLDTFLMKATNSDFGVFGAADDVDDESGQKLQSRFIDPETAKEIIPALVVLIETNPDDTAQKLHAYGGANGDLANVVRALETGAWPLNGNAAEESAAFAFHFLRIARQAEDMRMGLCWEFRGDVQNANL